MNNIYVYITNKDLEIQLLFYQLLAEVPGVTNRILKNEFLKKKYKF